ncbi:hypothetical protein QIA19_05075 (plasmid) [Borreliella finlandensis]|uniref:hypothetical protein n=1 Tax=Borreliella finlandensis TaxID=498741 RepID=UPI003AEFEA79
MLLYDEILGDNNSMRGVEDLFFQVLKHKSIIIEIEFLKSENSNKLTSSANYDLDGFQRLYKNMVYILKKYFSNTILIKIKNKINF